MIKQIHVNSKYFDVSVSKRSGKNSNLSLTSISINNSESDLEEEDSDYSSCSSISSSDGSTKLLSSRKSPEDRNDIKLYNLINKSLERLILKLVKRIMSKFISNLDPDF